MSFLFLILLSLTAFPCSRNAAAATRRNAHRQMSYDYYSKTCPQVEQLVASVTSQQFRDVPVSGPATIRLFFHDCFVQGCDASILIDTKPGSKDLAEKDALENRDLRTEGFETIDMAKSLVESKCPGIVSCADILAIAARDFVHLAGGPYYQVNKGRWDGRISTASNVSANIPKPNSTIDHLITLFGSNGLTIEDMVILSGAHTIGFAHCEHFLSRLYNYSGTGLPDPYVDPRLLKSLRMSCPEHGWNPDVIAPADVTTPFLFDNVIDQRTRPIVLELGNDKGKFFEKFGAAMEKMGSIGVKRGRRHGEKRKVCRVHWGV